MKNKILGILICILLIATAVPAVTSLNDNSIRLVLPRNSTQHCTQEDWSEIQKFLASDGTENDIFGWSVSLDGDTAIIGAPGDDTSKGSAYVFIRTGTTWTQEAKLLASDGAAGDYFGWSVSLSGDTALIGAPGASYGVSIIGCAYIFTRSGITWTQQAKLLPSDGEAGDEFGFYVSLDGDTALIGAVADDDIGYLSGSAYIFTRAGNTWSQQQKLLAADGGAEDRFGFSVSIDGDTALIGAIYGDGIVVGSGCVYEFIRTDTTWTQQQKLFASDGATYDIFGHSVSIDGDTALIGARFDEACAGSAYVFTRTGTTWAQQQKLTVSDPGVDDSFGISVSLSGDTALIRAMDEISGDDPGAAYVFTRIGTIWTQQAKLLPSDGVPGDWFGGRVSLFGDTALIGANYDDDNGYNSGSAYLFIRGNQQPIADFTWIPQNPNPGETITFNASASHDPNGYITLYEWDWNNDGVYEESHTNPTTTYSWSQGGIYPVTLQVTDNGSATDTVIKTVIVGNQPVVFGIPTPENGSTNNPLSFTWSIPISDPEGDLFTWAIECSNGQTNSEYCALNGTKSLALSGLTYLTTYVVWVNATDPGGSQIFVQAWYTFTTKAPNAPPVFGTPSPLNGSTNNPNSFTWSIPITDPQGDLFTWAIQCSNGQMNSGSGASNGTKSLALSGLVSSTTYKIWVNATDPDGSSLYTRAWYTFTTQQNAPPNKPNKPSGTASGKINTLYTYTTSTTDPNGDQVYYNWSWGDGNYSGWLGPFASGATASADHKWTVKKSYELKVKAKDPSGNESVWSDPLQVSMPTSFDIPMLGFLERLLERFPLMFPLLRHLLGY